MTVKADIGCGGGVFRLRIDGYGHKQAKFMGQKSGSNCGGLVMAVRVEGDAGQGRGLYLNNHHSCIHHSSIKFFD